MRRPALCSRTRAKPRPGTACAHVDAPRWSYRATLGRTRRAPHVPQSGVTRPQRECRLTCELSVRVACAVGYPRSGSLTHTQSGHAPLQLAPFKRTRDGEWPRGGERRSSFAIAKLPWLWTCVTSGQQPQLVCKTSHGPTERAACVPSWQMSASLPSASRRLCCTPRATRAVLLEWTDPGEVWAAAAAAAAAAYPT